MTLTRYIAGILLFSAVSILNGLPSWCAEAPVQAAVSIAPQKYFVEKIGGAHVAVTVMVPPGVEPHTYEPKPREVLALSRARVYFAIGAPFEYAWLPRFKSTNPRLLIVHTEENVPRIPLAQEEYHELVRAETPESGMDIHIWLSPPLVKIQAQSIFDGLAKIDPAHIEEYRANLTRFNAEIDSLDADLKKLFYGRQQAKSPLPPLLRGENGKFMVFHPAWAYFAQAYGLKEIPIEIAGKEPKPSELMKLIKLAREQKITVIFVQPQFSARSARTIADAIHGRLVYADPMAENWAKNLRTAAEEFKAALR
ncbi:MAG: zinc ABC transporter substrate-binding protein [Candidatus Latescibacter sp.]|nr:zinc ABC transporter substrate-binding protein [Candidatus Latescibacter sp.]